MEVTVLTKDSRLYKLYAWAQTIDHMFTKELETHVAAKFGMRTLPGMLYRTSTAVRDFLAFYEITEEELSYETAYKKWQRTRSYQQIKALRKRKTGRNTWLA